IFRSLLSVNTETYPGGLIARAIRGEMAVYAAHTNYDAAPGGVSVALAQALGLEGPSEVVVPKGEMRKIVVFVPEEDADAIADAMTEAGAGVVGKYTHCTFRSQGTGTFFGGKDTNPYAGEKGRLERVPELRVEAMAPACIARGTETAIREAHPYEEPALDVYPLDGHPEGCGYGRIANLPHSLAPDELANHVSQSLGSPACLVANPDPSRRLGRVAVLGGSGGSFVREAAASGAEAYVTGDIDYHDALLAESLGLVTIDAGHAPTELPSLEPLARRLVELVDVPVEVSRVRR
ncbi:MAG TPA: Nif3-like dinuclear metal center hexameric protein, partial [Rubrobacteraceae bacterium]|nr:Nif3-like dinuclear metal center hexameric protein [Rubrobacteraceae bacterium]